MESRGLCGRLEPEEQGEMGEAELREASVDETSVNDTSLYPGSPGLSSLLRERGAGRGKPVLCPKETLFQSRR